MRNLTVTLLRTIGSPLLPDFATEEPEESEALFRHAFRNNVEMLYLAAIERRRPLEVLQQKRVEMDRRLNDTLRTACRLSGVLQAAGITHVLTKTLRPYPGTPNDLDCLFLDPLDRYESAARYLQTQGFRLTGPNPMQYEFFDERSGTGFNSDKAGGRFYIDFYRELAADYMPYMDSALLRDEIVLQKVDGCDKAICLLRPRAEMTVLALHSVLMHRIVPLEVFYTYSYYLAAMRDDEVEDLWVFVRKNHAEPGMRAILTVIKALYQEAFGGVPAKLERLLAFSGSSAVELAALQRADMTMPHIIKLTTFVITVFGKIRGRRARRGFFRELAHMANPVFAVEVLYHMLSKKFIDKHSDHV